MFFERFLSFVRFNFVNLIILLDDNTEMKHLHLICLHFLSLLLSMRDIEKVHMYVYN